MSCTITTRAMRKELMDRYYMTGAKPALMRRYLQISYRYLTNDNSASESTSQSQVDERVVKYLLDADDPDLFWDLRRLNGQPRDTKFDPFWAELQNIWMSYAMGMTRDMGIVFT